MSYMTLDTRTMKIYIIIISPRNIRSGYSLDVPLGGILMGTHNIFYRGEIKKQISKYYGKRSALS